MPDREVDIGHVLEDVRGWETEKNFIVCLSLYFDDSISQKVRPFVFCIIHCNAHMLSLNADKSWCVTASVILTFACVRSRLFQVMRPQSGGYLTRGRSWVLTYPIDAFSPPCTTSTPPHPLPSTLACWREPCNNPPCFHDNHLLLSSPHLSLPPSLSFLTLSSPFQLSPSSLPTLLVFQGQRGSQADVRYRQRYGRKVGKGEW